MIVNSHVGVIEYSYRTNEVVLDTDTGQQLVRVLPHTRAGAPCNDTCDNRGSRPKLRNGHCVTHRTGGRMMVTPDALKAAGWHLTTDHAASSYRVPVIIAPDGQAIGDGDLVRVRWDGALVEDPFGPEGRLLAGVSIREMLEELGDDV